MFLSRNALLLSTLCLLGLSAQAITPPYGRASIYSYTDDAGVRNFTNQLESVPEKYRGRLTTQEFDAPSNSPTASPHAKTEPPIRSADSRIVTASGEYRMGDHDTRPDGVRLAIEAA